MPEKTLFFKPSPLSPSIIIITVLTSFILLGVPIYFLSNPPIPSSIEPLIFLLPSIWILSLSSRIKGYELSSNRFTVYRILWKNSFTLLSPLLAKRENGEAKISIRVFGNGGMFSASGYFWSRSLGIYRSFVTHPFRLVILKIGKKTLVLSPDDPDLFIQSVNQREISSSKNQHPHPLDSAI